MSNVNFLRDKYGLNQNQMAEWLGVPRSQVAHFERDTRKLPKEASAKHTQMLIAMAKMETAAAKTGNNRKPHPETLPRLNDLKKEIEYQKKAAAYKAGKMKKALIAVQKQYKQTRDFIELADNLLKVVTKEKDKEGFLWLRTQSVKAKKKLLKCDEAAQLKMRVKIAMLEGVSNSEF